MYERFGEMNSYTEINELAENLPTKATGRACSPLRRRTGSRRT